MSEFLTDDELPAFVALLAKYEGSMARMSRGEGLSYDQVKRRKIRAVAMGLWDIKHKVPYGFEIKQVTDQVDADGNIITQSIKMGDPKGEKFVAPAGQRIKGVSALVDSEGNEKIKWIKTEAEKLSIEQKVEAVKAAFTDFIPTKPSLIIPKSGDNDLLTVYPVLDWHIGMMAHGAETGGRDWDLGIARTVLVNNFAELVDRTPNSRNAVMMCLGDLLHADNSKNTTSRSENNLDVDSRYDKVLRTASEIIYDCSQIIASKHKNVEMAFKRGNHDDESTKAIRLAMHWAYKGHHRIIMENSYNDDFYYKRFGVNLIGGTHGDKAKIPKLPMAMANHRRKDWSECSTFHYFTGHVHHYTSVEEGGVTAWSLRAPIPQDAYHAGMAFLSGQSMYAMNYHFTRGSRGFTELEIQDGV